MIKRKHAVLAVANTCVVAGLIVGGGLPASALANTIQVCVTTSNSGSIKIPADHRRGLSSPRISKGHCWSAYFDTGGTRTIYMDKHDGMVPRTTTWNSNQGSKSIYL